MDAHDKLALLSQEAQYDLSCACGSKDQDRRVRGPDGLWVYPASVPKGGKAVILKTLMTNACQNDCAYCPLRRGEDTRRVTLQPEQVAGMFLDYLRRTPIHGLFLTSGVPAQPDGAMQRIVDTAEILRKRHRYRGFLHLKIIPGASDAAVDAALSLASTVSLNVEAPTRSTFRELSSSKDFDRDIVRTIRRISERTAPGGPNARVKQTTQFIVGAGRERDSEIVSATFGLYRRLRLKRVYFSAYQNLQDRSRLLHVPGEANVSERLLTREHRLYQADFLIRRYRWDVGDFLYGEDGNLALDADPKLTWARRHPEYFPVRLRSAGRESLLRVPGLGPITVDRILQTRREGHFRSLRDVGVKGKRLQKASAYVVME